ncbi:divalent cation tolerance protein CutA [Kribbella sp. WER1]
MDGYVQVSTTVPSREDAERLAGRAVAECFAASAEVSGPITTFNWHPRGHRASSGWRVNLTTTQRRYPALETYLLAGHPATDPDIIALPLSGPAMCLDRLDRMTFA